MVKIKLSGASSQLQKNQDVDAKNATKILLKL